LCLVSYVVNLKFEPNEEETCFKFLANLEYEFWFSGYPVWLCLAKCQCQPNIRNPWSQCRRHSNFVDCGPGYRVDYSANHRAHERQNLESFWTAPAIFYGWSHSGFAGFAPDAKFASFVDGRRLALDYGCIDQRFDGTLPCICRRYAAK